ncbi:MAG: hypothetical protein QXS20_01235 [Candidatus Thorarchaeota archaeon]
MSVDDTPLCSRGAKLLEIPVWLHLLGKFTSEFYSCPSAAREIPDGLDKEVDLDRNYDTVLGLQAPANLTIRSAITQHHKQSSKIQSVLDLLSDSHGRSSGTDKGWMFQEGGLFEGSGKQENEYYRASPFGYESQESKIDLADIDPRRKRLYKCLGKILRQPCTRESVRKLEEVLCCGYEGMLSETRRPMNDVTLSDATESAVAFFRAALTDYQFCRSCKKPKWRMCRLSIDTLEYISIASGIPELRGKLKAVEDILDAAKNLIEYEMSIGHEIYRDEGGSTYLLPVFPEPVWHCVKKKLESEIRAILGQILNHDFPTVLEESKGGPDRNLTGFQELVTRPAISLTPDLHSVDAAWKDMKTPVGLCVMCGWNPVERGTRSYLCSCCNGQREPRAAQWLESLGSTIWIDEVSDEHGQVALLCGCFELDDWLSGHLVRTIMSWHDEDLDLKRVNQALAEWKKGSKSQMKGIIPKFVTENFSFGDALKFLYGDKTVKTDEVKTMAWLLLSQQDSPARIMRLWRTTRDFWDSSLASIVKETEVKRRLRMTPEDPLNMPCGAYELVQDRITLPVYWDDHRGHFISIFSLEFIERHYGVGNIISFLQGNNSEFEIVEAGGYGEPSRSIRRTKIAEVKELDCKYSATVEVITSPRTFMIFVPASRALELTRMIKEKYEIEMGFVRNRLPIHLGVLVGDKRTPVRVFLDAGRRMLRQQLPQDGWRVEEVTECLELPGHLKRSQQYTKAVSITLEKDEQRLRWIVPLMMGDGKTQDEWYGYCIVTKPSGNTESRKKYLEIPDPRNESQLVHLCHVSELAVGDVVCFMPSTFDFEFVGGGPTRYEICYADDGTRTTTKRRPYLLEDLGMMLAKWEELKRHLSMTQIHQVIELIEGKRTEWGIVDPPDPVFIDFCRSVLESAEWKSVDNRYPWSETSREEWFTETARLAARGVLADIVNLHIRILRLDKGGEE